MKKERQEKTLKLKNRTTCKASIRTNKKLAFTILLIIFLCSCFASRVEAKDEAEVTSTETILKSQSDSLGISSFIEEANKYKDDNFDIDIGEIISSAIKGNIDNEKLGKNILSILFSQTKEAISSIGSIMVVIIISSVLKSISDDLENKGIAKITYYVTYILIVTIIMKNFSDIITMVKSSIENLIAFSNSLIPLLITLMITTRKCSISKHATTHNTINYYVYRKFYKCSANPCKFNICCIKHNFQYI